MMATKSSPRNGYLGDFSPILAGASVFERRAFLRSFIESIRAEDHQVTIRYTLPLPPERVQMDALGVLDFDSSGVQF